ncbi:MAG: serine hydrolase domain-containing protein [Planctomycetia bacterium]|nr:serine hydrolase domain-containing protein [Planctomycetia bacterium]
MKNILSRRDFTNLTLGTAITGMLFDTTVSFGSQTKAAGQGTCGKNTSYLPLVTPAEVGMSALDTTSIDRLIEELITNRNTPGAVVVIGRGNRVCFQKVYGNRQQYPTIEPMTLDTIFDMASVTKVAATGLSVNILLDRGLIELDSPAKKYLAEFARNGKDDITVKSLLLHVSGIQDKYNMHGSESQIWQNICNTGIVAKPFQRYEYSCLGYVVLGKIIERVSGMSLPDFAKKNIYEPLGMNDTCFTPDEKLRVRTAPTEKRDGRWLRGEVNDHRSNYAGGRLGNAGLFSTGPDLAILASVILNHGRYIKVDGTKAKLFSEKTFQNMIACYPVPNGVRGLSWDKKTGKPNLPPEMSELGIGHGGWTGTSLMIDVPRNLFVIVLTTRRHLDTSKPNIYPTAGKIAQRAIASIND